MLFDKKTCLLVEQEAMPSCLATEHVFMFDEGTCLRVAQENMLSCSAARHVFLLNKMTCLLVQRKDVLLVVPVRTARVQLRFRQFLFVRFWFVLRVLVAGGSCDSVR